MIETKIGGINITTDTAKNTDPFIIALFAPENAGKTRLSLTGKDVIGFCALEMKAYKTLDKDSLAFGKRVARPQDPMDLIVRHREVSVMKDVDQQIFYAKHIAKVKNYIYALLEHKDVNTVVIDKFSTMCTWFEYAVNGMKDKFIKVEGNLYKDRRELNQTIIDFLNSLSQYKKTVVLTNAAKDDYEVLGPDKKPFRQTWESFKYLGSHVNLVIELQDNKFFDAGKPDNPKHNWRYLLNVRRCQDRPELEGPMGQRLLTDEEITIPNLIMQVNPDGEIEDYL